MREDSIKMLLTVVCDAIDACQLQKNQASCRKTGSMDVSLTSHADDLPKRAFASNRQR
jgi:hypothetical protein